MGIVKIFEYRCSCTWRLECCPILWIFILYYILFILWIRLCNTIFCTNLINQNVNVHPNSDFYEHHCSQLSTERKWNRIYIEICFINVTTSTIFSIFYSNSVQMLYVATVGYHFMQTNRKLSYASSFHDFRSFAIFICLLHTNNTLLIILLPYKFRYIAFRFLFSQIPL